VFGPPIPFGLSSFEAAVFDSAGHDYTQAGGHPFSALGTYVFNRKSQLTGEQFDGKSESNFVPVEHVKQVITDLPRGFVGNALAVPQLCPSPENVISAKDPCPPASRVGALNLTFSGTEASQFFLYAIEPEFGTPAQFAFEGGGGLFTLSARLRPEDGYAITLELSPSPLPPPLAPRGDREST